MQGIGVVPATEVLGCVPSDSAGDEAVQETPWAVRPCRGSVDRQLRQHHRRDTGMTEGEAAATQQVRDVVDEATFCELLDPCIAAAKARGGVFIFDEGNQLLGERTQARYLQTLARSVGWDELADRLDPELFAPGVFERMWNEGRISVGQPRGGLAPGPQQGSATLQ